MHNYLLGTGSFNGSPGLDWFAKIWLDNTVMFGDPLPAQIVVVSVGDSKPPYPAVTPDGLCKITTLDLPGNLGHVHQLLGKKPPFKTYNHCGAVGTFMALAMIAYCAECDFVYKEQDCLAFGPWVNQLYHCMTPEGGMAFGRGKMLGSAQSLFVVRHGFIPTFVDYLINSGSERQLQNLPEYKFNRLIEKMPVKVKWLNFGYDRDRPFDSRDMIWYAQKFTPDELRKIAAEGLVDITGMPDNVGIFTNDVIGHENDIK
jgi:hypothetical protein